MSVADDNEKAAIDKYDEAERAFNALDGDVDAFQGAIYHMLAAQVQSNLTLASRLEELRERMPAWDEFNESMDRIGQTFSSHLAKERDLLWLKRE